MIALKNLQKKIQEQKEKDRQWNLRKEKNIIPEKNPQLYGFKPANKKDYANWLIGYLKNGGQVSHVYDYEFPGFFIAKKDFKLGSLYGANSIQVIIPEGIKTSNASGHNTYYFMDDFKTSGYGWVPIYSDIIPIVEKELKKIERDKYKGSLSLNKNKGGELSKVNFDGKELSMKNKSDKEDYAREKINQIIEVLKKSIAEDELKIKDLKKRIKKISKYD